MSVAIVTVPQFAFPASGGVKVVVTASAASANFVRLWVTSAPDGTGFAEALALLGSGARLELVGDDPLTIQRLALTRGGRYTFVAQEYTKGAAGYGGGFDGSADAVPSETKIGAEQTITVDVGQRLETTLGATAYGFATLRLWVFGDTVRQTTRATHGEATPAIVLPTTERARTAALSTSVASAIGALIDATASALLGNFDALVENMRDKLPKHFNNLGGAYHASPDTDNDTEIEDLPAAPINAEGIAEAAEVVRRRLEAHMRNSQARYHNASGPTPDLANLPISIPPVGPTQMANAIASLADTFRAYEAHRLDTAAHGPTNTDTTNVLTASPGLLLAVHRAFLDELRKLAPAAPPIHNPATTTLLHGGGFTLTTP